LLPDSEAVPFGDIDALAQKLSSRRFAAFIVEPIQAEGGIRVPGPTYLAAAQELCRRHGSLFVTDEVQTGMYRTGPFLAGHHFGVQPDMVILAKALSGGLVPTAAVLMSDAVYSSVYTSLKRAIVHTSTFSENGLSMRAGLATLEVMDEERLGERASRLGQLLRERLRQVLAGYEMVAGVLGEGLLSGIQFQPPQSLALRLPFEAFSRIHPGMFGQMLVMRLFREQRILTQICGNNFMVLKAAPPLVVSEQQIERFVGAVQREVEVIHASCTFWTDALALARRALNV
jgi:ornithine--oxo-acid transaminase